VTCPPLGPSGQPLRVLYPFNLHRGGGGADNTARATVEACRQGGVAVQVFTRDSEALSAKRFGRWRAGLSALYAPTAVREFEAAISTFRPDIVHAHEVFPLVSPWIFPLCSRLGIPLVVTCIDYRLSCPVVTHLRNDKLCTLCSGGRSYQALLHNCRGSIPESLTVALYNTMVQKLRLMSDYVDEFIAPSPFAREWLIEHAGLPRETTAIFPVVTVPSSAVDPATGAYVAFAGRLAPEKGIVTFVDAARRCDFPFKIARHVDSKVSAIVQDGIEVVVTHGKDDLAQFYRGARVFVFPSLFFETFGIVAGESMSHGVPIVTSRFGAMQNLIEDGVSGLFFERGNAADLAEKLNRLWNDADLLRRLGNAARHRAVSLWRPERHFEITLAVYQRAMERRRIKARGEVSRL
jgi:glycosyltransferase involved in cell wall biosynthesis